jgi:uncharacterized protein
MTGEKNLTALLQQMRPTLHEGSFVFCSVPTGQVLDIDEASIVMRFREQEGETLILPRAAADALGISYHYESAWITLTVHSALEAVGLTAAFSTALAAAGISCNVVAGYYHDHIFVDVRDAEKAMHALKNIGLSTETQA